MIKDAYNYIFHCSDYRSTDTRWACFKRDDESAYWNGSPNRWGNETKTQITMGRTPDEAWQKMKRLNEQTADV